MILDLGLAIGAFMRVNQEHRRTAIRCRQAQKAPCSHDEVQILVLPQKEFFAECRQSSIMVTHAMVAGGVRHRYDLQMACRLGCAA